MITSFRTIAAAIAALLAVDFALPAFAQQQQQQQPQQRQQRPPRQQQPSQPTQQPPPNVELPPEGTPTVVVDVLLILRDSRAAQSVRGQVERVRNSYQAEISKQENELRAADQELAKQRATLSPEAFAQKRRELEKRVGEAQKIVEDRRRGLDQSFNQGMEKIQQAMVEIITEIAIDKKYQLILPKSQVVVVSNALDITSEVMKRVNSKLPNVQVALPKN